MAEYNPVTGENYDQDAAREHWNASMNRGAPKWSIRGARPAEFYWSFFDFRSWTGRVTVQADGFHWSTHDYGTGDLIHEGVTTSIYEAYQSVVQNRPVSREELADA
jgi:hypothetical protein